MLVGAEVEMPARSCVVDLASPRTGAVKPDRLNFARVCLWCGVRDCEELRCIELYARSRWMVCDECHGFSAGDCLCVHGVVEATPAGAAATA